MVSSLSCLLHEHPSMIRPLGQADGVVIVQLANVAVAAPCGDGDAVEESSEEEVVPGLLDLSGEDAVMTGAADPLSGAVQRARQSRRH